MCGMSKNARFGSKCPLLPGLFKCDFQACVFLRGRPVVSGVDLALCCYLYWQLFVTLYVFLKYLYLSEVFFYRDR